MKNYCMRSTLVVEDNTQYYESNIPLPVRPKCRPEYHTSRASCMHGDPGGSVSASERAVICQELITIFKLSLPGVK